MCEKVSKKMKKCFTIETRLKKSEMNIDYFENNLIKQNRIFRIVWNLIQTTTLTSSQLNTYLQNEYHIDKRTANTLINVARGELVALKGLKKVELENLRVKILQIENQIKELSLTINDMKEKAAENRLKPSELDRYCTIKKNLWQKKQKLNCMKQKFDQYESVDTYTILPVCWGTKKMFKAQYYLKENGFKTHESWLHAFRKREIIKLTLLDQLVNLKGIRIVS